MKFNHSTVNPEAYQTMLKFHQFTEGTAIEPKLRELIKIRVSQINGCAFCIDMHARDVRKHGESEQRIVLLNAWRETTLYSEAEKAALALAECATVLSSHGVPDQVYEQVLEHFSEKEFVDLLMIINDINSWNRFGVSLHLQPEPR
ncbi:carboxymuconolactone decarboxylase family protein [Paenibacillus nasutitermitis]|uniref:Carboxymuconolactone decarboxylase-like domain-containing protein n=1 Tax=Paenibacillus nasutitermitis TaxID=1652958 RepID=A0A917DUA9_9BACL|nr:carboxymuconolactone decarboxylase family protein [Paenibacillus nasutitermitis]GGD67483.1 hypothetical protein GCM10010911_26560 [Paenibacillus nasutitermitis]